MAAPELFANNFAAQLQSGIAAGDTTITLTTAVPSALQASGQWRAIIQDSLGTEYVIIPGGQAGPTVTGVTRGAEGSTATSHPAGAWVTHVVSAGALNNLIGIGSTFTGTILGGTGDNLTNQLASPATGQLLEFAIGTVASPDTTLNPVLKVNRTLSLTSAVVTGDAGEQAAAIHGITKGDANTQIQTVGVLGSAQNYGTAKGSTDSPDACAVYGLGRILGSGIGVGIGGFFRGQADSANGLMTGLQAQTYNNTGRDDNVATSNFANSAIMWLWAAGPNRTGEGVSFANPFGQQTDVGWHFVGQTPAGFARTDASCATTNASKTVTDANCVAGDLGRVVTGTGIPSNTIVTSVTAGTSFTISQNATATNNPVSLTLTQTGPTRTADIQSDSAALTSILIGGSHNIALATKQGAGPVIIGGTTIQAGAALEVQATTAQRPLASVGTPSTVGNISLFIQNSTSGSEYFAVSSTNGILTGTVSGDTGVRVITSSAFWHVGGTVSTIKVGQANTLGFFNVTAVAQQAGTGNTTTVAAGSTTSVFTNTTFSGGVGSTGYTVGDIVKALKNYGLLAQ